MDTERCFASSALEAVLRAELAAGNGIKQDGRWGEIERLVVLRGPFRTAGEAEALPGGVERRAVNDPHYWQSELFDPATREMLACGFGEMGAGWTCDSPPAAPGAEGGRDG